MPVDESALQQEVSYAYAWHVASAAGFIATRPQMDQDSVDLNIRAKGAVDETSTLHGISIDIQLKTCITFDLHDEHIHYNLKVKNYQDLRVTEVATPRFLVVLFIPPQRNDWLDVDHERLISRRAAYWCSLRNATESQNQATQVVHIPRANLFTPEALRELMATTSREEHIDYAG